MRAVGVSHSTHDKLPDLVFHLPAQNWLIMVEAVTTHGPCSPKRREELETALRDCPARRVYISAFLTFREFKQYIGEGKIAWDTEVWMAEVPDHMIHYNGPKFLAPVG